MVTRLKKIRILYLLDLFEERGENGQCDLVYVECLFDWANNGYVDVLFKCKVSVVLVLLGVGLHTLNFLESSLSVIQQDIQ